jgi:hypothetical protein
LRFGIPEMPITVRRLLRERAHRRHCEEHLRRSNPDLLRRAGLLRFARNDESQNNGGT